MGKAHYIANESGGIEVANGLIDSITDVLILRVVHGRRDMEALFKP